MLLKVTENAKRAGPEAHPMGGVCNVFSGLTVATFHQCWGNPRLLSVARLDVGLRLGDGLRRGFLEGAQGLTLAGIRAALGGGRDGKGGGSSQRQSGGFENIGTGHGSDPYVVFV